MGRPGWMWRSSIFHSRPPGEEVPAGQFGAVVAADRLRSSALRDQLIEHARDPAAGETGIRAKPLSSSKGKVNHVALLGTAKKPEWRHEQADLFVSLSGAPKMEGPIYSVRATF